MSKPPLSSLAVTGNVTLGTEKSEAAIRAMHALILNTNHGHSSIRVSAVAIAKWAREIADAMENEAHKRGEWMNEWTERPADDDPVG